MASLSLSIPVCQQSTISELPGYQLSGIQLEVVNAHLAGGKILFLGEKIDLDYANDLVTFVEDSPIPEEEFNVIFLHKFQIVEHPDFGPKDPNVDYDCRTAPKHIAFGVAVLEQHYAKLAALIYNNAFVVFC